MPLRWNAEELKNNDATGVTDDSRDNLSGGLQQGYELGSLTDGLVAYFPFDGSVEDKALSHSVTDNTSAGFVSGKVGSEAKDFDGSDDFIQIDTQSTLSNIGSSSTDDYTYSMWIKTNDGGNNWFISDRVPSGTKNRRCELGINSDGSIDYNWGRFDGSTTVNNEIWHHVVLVVRGTNEYGYVDGNLDGSGSRPSDVSNTEIFMGAHLNDDGSLSGFFSGQIDDLRIYARALSMPEIEALYNRTSTQKITDKDRLTSGLVGHWPLNEDDTSSAYDLSGRGNDASSVMGTNTTVGLGGAIARKFNGGDEFIEIGNAVLGISSDFSVNFWVNPDDVTPSDEMQLIMENGRDVTSTIKSGEVRFRVYDGSSNYQSHYSISKDQWTMLTATWDYSNNTLKFYKNAVNSPAGSNKANGNAGHTGFRIGDHPSSGYGSYKGSIADLRAYNRVLTKSEIEELARQGGL